MRITIHMDGDLFDTAQAAARRSGRSLSRFVQDAVKRELALEATAGSARWPGLLTFSGTGLVAGVDIDSNAALRTAMGEG